MRGSEARRQATQSPSKAKLRARRAEGRRTRAPAQSLPPRCYTSPEFYALEVERILRREWLCVGRVEQVRAPGDYFSIDLMGEPLVVVRDQEGRIRALSRVCRHRAMLVVSGAGNARSFICPYHAWTYGLDGRLAGAPEMARTPGFDPSSCRLPEIPTELWEGFIFVNLGGDAQPLAPRLEGLARRLRNWSVAGMEGVRSLD
ncbi:MAG: aromatic ring-hydroxylating oxygenase subunit alpha, partial [Alphaproteobacteria bacterium]